MGERLIDRPDGAVTVDACRCIVVACVFVAAAVAARSPTPRGARKPTELRQCGRDHEQSAPHDRSRSAGSDGHRSADPGPYGGSGPDRDTAAFDQRPRQRTASDVRSGVDRPGGDGPADSSTPTHPVPMEPPPPSTTTTVAATALTTPVFAVEPSSADFGNVGLGHFGGNAFFVRNISTSPQQIGDVRVQFDSGPPVFASTTSAATHPSSRPWSTMSIVIMFAPSALGAVSATATVIMGGASPTLSLRGTGIEPNTPPTFGDFQIEPLDLDLAACRSVTVSASTTITNVGATTQSDFFAIDTSADELHDGGTWSLADTCTGATLAPNQSCTITVTFTPVRRGSVPPSSF